MTLLLSGCVVECRMTLSMASLSCSAAACLEKHMHSPISEVPTLRAAPSVPPARPLVLVLQLFEYLIAEHLIDTARRVYCPYKDCSVLLERPEPDEEMVDGAGNQEAPYECPCCKRHFCLHCGITGWHTVSTGGVAVDLIVVDWWGGPTGSACQTGAPRDEGVVYSGPC